MASHKFTASAKGLSKSATIRIGGINDIIVFVPGTMDPLNTNSNQHIANRSYYRPQNPEDCNFWTKIKELKHNYDNLHIMDEFFSWSGDNSIDQRVKAGERLAEKIWKVYSPKKNQKCYFHLIGHSHGGNVINEFTKAIARDNRNFPDLWEIRSIVYLSTPFFEELHAICGKKLHKNCTIINVRNEFDITQRIIASFSCNNLEKFIMGFNSKKILIPLKTISLIASSGIFNIFGEYTNFINDDIEGPLIWSRMAILIENFIKITCCIRSALVETKNEISETNPFNLELVIFLQILGHLILALEESRFRFTSRENNYNSFTFGSDLNADGLFSQLNQLLLIGDTLYDSRPIKVMAGLISNKIISKVEKTFCTPAHQFENDSRFDNVVFKDVLISKFDDYSHRYMTNFEVFAKEAEGYINQKNPDLMKFLMLLIAQLIAPNTIGGRPAQLIEELASQLDKLDYIVADVQDHQLKIFYQNFLNKYRQLINDYHRALVSPLDLTPETEETPMNLETEVFSWQAQAEFTQDLVDYYTQTIINSSVENTAGEDSPETPAPLVGSLQYFATVSHSLSYSDLWDEVANGLKESFGSAMLL